MSYGLYIYHWPVFQLLVLTGLATAAPPVFLTGLAVALAAAVASWFLVERPALRRKHSPLPDRVAAAVVTLPRPRTAPDEQAEDRAPAGAGTRGR